MKRMAVVLLLALIGLGGYGGYLKYGEREPSSGLQATGAVEATQVDLRSKLPGVLQNFSVQAGDEVREGQIIATIVRNDLVAQKERDALGVLKAQAQLDDLLSGARELEVKDAEIAVDTAQNNLDKASRDYDRALALFRENAVAGVELEKFALALKQAQNQLDSAKTRLALLQSGSRPKQIELARAELERCRAVLKASEAMLEDTKIVCPLDGTVLSKNFEPGEYIPAGAPVATVANLKDMWIKVYLPTDDLPRIKLGQRVKIAISGSAAEYEGYIKEIASKGEFTPKTIQTKKERTNIVFAVKIGVNNGDGILKPGMPADVIMDQGDKK